MASGPIWTITGSMFGKGQGGQRQGKICRSNRVSRTGDSGADHAAGFWQGQGGPRAARREVIAHRWHFCHDVWWPELVTISLQSTPSATTSKPTTRGFAMSTGPNRILDEFAKLMTDAAGAAQGVRARGRDRLPRAGRKGPQLAWTWCSARNSRPSRDMADQGACREQGLGRPHRGARGETRSLAGEAADEAAPAAVGKAPHKKIIR